ncbi:BTB/POZ domain-containing protein 18 [Lissotriton helveticus]
MSNITYRSSRLLRATFIQLHLQQKAGLFCDVFLQAEGEVISAHACVLSACSPFFTERLNGTRSMGQPRHLNLPGIKPITLQKLVHYLYTSELEVTREELDGVLAAARQLHIPELEVLQLQGVKLVRTDSWPRLNRKCFKACDQPSLQGAAQIKDSRDINQALRPDPAGEKGRDVTMVEGSSTRLSDTLLSVRCCQKPLSAVDCEERYTDSEPSCSPMHTPSCGSETVSINSPTPSSCESLEPLPDSTESSTESSLPPVRRIKLSRFKFSVPANIPRIPAPGRAYDSLDIVRRTSCQRTVTTDTSQGCLQFTDSKSSTPSTGECLPTSSVKKSVPKSGDSMVQHSVPTKKNSSASADMNNLGCWEITNIHPQSQQDHKVQSRMNQAQVKTPETPHVFSRASDLNKSLSIASCDSTGSVSSKGTSKITSKSPESKILHKEQPLENLAHLPTIETANALSCANKPRESVSVQPSSSEAGVHASCGEGNVEQIKITRSAQLENGHDMHLPEESGQLPLCGSTDIPSPTNDQKQSITASSRLSTGSCNTLGVGSQSQFTTGSALSENVSKQHLLEEVTLGESAQVSPPSNKCDSVRMSPGLSTANCTTPAGESSRGQLKITSRTPRSEGDDKGNPMKGLGVCESSNGLSPTDGQMLSMAHPLQRHPSSAAIREDSEPVRQSEEQLDLVLPLSASSQPAQEEESPITQGRDVETEHSDPALAPVLMPTCRVDDVTKKSFPEGRVRDKEMQQHEVSEGTKRLPNNVPPCQDDIDSVTVKPETHSIRTMDQTPLSVNAAIQDEAQNTKVRKRPAIARKKAVIPPQKRRRHDHSSVSTVKDFHKPRSSGTTTSSVLLQGRVSGSPDATCLDDAKSELSDFRIVASSREADPTVDSSVGCFLDSLIELSFPSEEEEIDVGGIVWNGHSDIASCCVRPDSSSESDMDINVLD